MTNSTGQFQIILHQVKHEPFGELMFFHLRLFLHAIDKNKKYLFFTLLPPVAYLVIQAYIPHKYTLVQDLVTEEQTAFVLGTNPLDIVPLQEITENPDVLFTDNLALMDLRNYLLIQEAVHRPEWQSWLPSQFNLFVQRSLHQNVSLKADAPNQISLVYTGSDRKLGQAIIKFYAQRLIHGAKRARERSLVDVAVSRPQADVEQGSFPGIALDGSLQISATRLLYHPDRLGPSLWILFVSIIIFLALVWLLEYARPKLYTSRQAARYLNVRVIGQLPDLNKLKFH